MGGGGYADDGRLCPNCPADGLTLFEAMLFANAMTKRYGNPSDTVYVYSAINSTNSTGLYKKIKPREVVGLQNLQIATDKTGYRLPTRGEFHYIYYKGVLLDFPWDDLYPPKICGKPMIGTFGILPIAEESHKSLPPKNRLLGISMISSAMPMNGQPLQAKIILASSWQWAGL
jgi:hypothetical protein